MAILGKIQSIYARQIIKGTNPFLENLLTCCKNLKSCGFSLSWEGYGIESVKFKHELDSLPSYKILRVGPAGDISIENLAGEIFACFDNPRDFFSWLNIPNKKNRKAIEV